MSTYCHHPSTPPRFHHSTIARLRNLCQRRSCRWRLCLTLLPAFIFATGSAVSIVRCAGLIRCCCTFGFAYYRFQRKRFFSLLLCRFLPRAVYFFLIPPPCWRYVCLHLHLRLLRVQNDTRGRCVCLARACPLSLCSGGIFPIGSNGLCRVSGQTDRKEVSWYVWRSYSHLCMPVKQVVVLTAPASGYLSLSLLLFP